MLRRLQPGAFVMRVKSLMALAAITAAFVTVSQSASAFDLNSPDNRSQTGWSHENGQWDYSSRYPRGYLNDRYSYFYDPRGYYPYYNSGQWGPPRIDRFKGTLPPYYASWGAWKKRYYHVEWHRRHYGGHRRGDW
ncbi:MAG TPA: hypothetical protein VN623_09385 [Hyphomicrobium sp.]|jgi:hypothetical protein|uniref:hypothetical protein n=1 Tax=Hyphomicrobium sp. TaxID=82 RepID=UPI002BE5CEA6|nr:hypothetical protein [Hyphomicrobium sp.]HXE02148.1 hypothetical protein [Hyphomicrobium sp.]